MKSIVGIIIAAILAVLVFLCTYTVKEWEQALILQFGEYKRVVNPWDGKAKGANAGLKFKSPIETVVLLDRRNLDLDFDPVRIRDVESNPLLVDAFVRYRITDPVQYYKRFKTKDRLRASFKPIVESSLRDSLGKVDTNTIIAGRRAELMQEIQDAANRKADVENYGIQVIDVRIKRADYPNEVALSVFGRMEADRKQAAAKLREDGKEAAQRIINNATREARVIKATAREEAERTKGEGDGARNATYAEAYNLDPEFFAFYRSMEAYKTGLSDGTTYVLSPNSDFLSYLDNQKGPGRR